MMNSAIHLQALPFIARPRQQMTPYTRTLQKSPHLPNYKGLNRITHLLCNQCVTVSFVVFLFFSSILSFVFSHIQPLFCKMGGWGTHEVRYGLDQSEPVFADAAAAEDYFSRVAHRQMGSNMAAVEKEKRKMSLVSFVDTPKFEEYKKRFAEHYKLTPRPDGGN